MSKRPKSAVPEAAPLPSTIPEPARLAEVASSAIALSASTPAPYQNGFMPTVGGTTEAISHLPKEDPLAPSLVEYGAPGIAIIGGILTDGDYNPDFGWRQGVRIYDQMRRSEPTVAQVVSLMNGPLIAATYKVAPPSPDPKYLEQASYTETCLFHDLEGQDWISLIREILTKNVFAFSVFEKVFAIRPDGSVKWEKFAPRLQKTIYRWWEGEDKKLAAIQQWTWNASIQNYELIDIPASKLLVFTTNQEGNNYEGISPLRPGYKAFFFKSAYEKLAAVGFEREHVGIPVIGLPEGYSFDDRKRAQQIGKNARSNEVGYIVLPPGWTVEWLKSRSPEKKGSGISDAIRYYDSQLLNSILAGFLLMGQSGTGSYAASTDQSQIFLKDRQADAKYVCSVFSQDAFPQLVRYNYGPQAMYPRLVAQNVAAYSIKDISHALAEVAREGLLRPSVEVEDYIYETFSIPTAPGNTIEATLNGRGGLMPDATGKTPLPMTPEEQIAMANRMTKDLQRITAMAPSGTGSQGDPNATPRIHPSNMARSTDSKPGTAGTVGAGDDGGAAMHQVNDVYTTYLTEGYSPLIRTLRQGGHQQQAYLRMAAEAGRPRITLYGDYTFASHPLSGAVALSQSAASRTQVQEQRLARRRNLVSGLSAEVRTSIEELRQDLHAAVASHDHDHDHEEDYRDA